MPWQTKRGIFQSVAAWVRIKGNWKGRKRAPGVAWSVSTCPAVAPRSRRARWVQVRRDAAPRRGRSSGRARRGEPLRRHRCTGRRTAWSLGGVARRGRTRGDVQAGDGNAPLTVREPAWWQEAARTLDGAHGAIWSTLVTSVETDESSHVFSLAGASATPHLAFSSSSSSRFSLCSGLMRWVFTMQRVLLLLLLLLSLRLYYLLPLQSLVHQRPHLKQSRITLLCLLKYPPISVCICRDRLLLYRDTEPQQATRIPSQISAPLWVSTKIF